MISIAYLRSRLAGSWVAFDEEGKVLDIEIPGDVGPAALLVTALTDALKTVDDSDRVTGSIDRAGMWSVDAILLNVVALDRLPDGEVTFDELMEAVRKSGLVWQIRPTSAP